MKRQGWGNLPLPFEMKQYKKLYDYISKTISGSVLDIGCGDAPLEETIEDYHGFDLAPQRINNRIWKGDAYDKNNYGDYDNYVLTEVLEHLEDDREVLGNIPKGKTVVLSVPSFYDRGHLRVFTEKTLQKRYGDILRFHKVVRFDCVLAKKKPFDVYLLLVYATKL